jgi:clan AA aspartic protease (TIGR02281 family)
MRKFLLAATVAVFPFAAAAQTSPMFDRGLHDRTVWETWFTGLPSGSDYKTGAEYWANHRSDPVPPLCHTIGTSEMVRGCIAARTLLVPADMLRHSTPDYKLGWNSYAVPPPVEALPAVPPPAMPDIATLAAPPAPPPVPAFDPAVPVPAFASPAPRVASPVPVAPDVAAPPAAPGAAPAPVVTPPAPAIADDRHAEIPFSHGLHGETRITGKVNGIAVEFMMDTGATMTAIAESDITYSAADVVDHERFIMADGHTAVVPIILVHKLTIGDISIHNVRVSISSGRDSLLGADLLNKFTALKVNNSRNVLEVSW